MTGTCGIYGRRSISFKKQKEWVCKPSSVSCLLRRVAAIYLDRLLPVGSAFRQATYLLLIPGPSTSCLVLQAVGFTLPAPSPALRCALTAPFHHCLCHDESGPSAVWFLWHFPAGHPGWPLAITVPCPARTFLPAPILRYQ